MELPDPSTATMNLASKSPSLNGLTPPVQFCMGLISFLSAGIGLIAGVVAFALYKLIGLFTNLFFFQRWSTDFISVRFHQLGWWVIAVPVIGGVVVGIMAKYGSPKI